MTRPLLPAGLAAVHTDLPAAASVGEGLCSCCCCYKAVRNRPDSVRDERDAGVPGGPVVVETLAAAEIAAPGERRCRGASDTLVVAAAVSAAGAAA